MSVRVIRTQLGDMATNCYVLIDSDTSAFAVVDPGDYGERFKALLKSQGIEKLDYILLTHGHYDHIRGVKRLKDDFGGKVVIHSLDAECLFNSEKSLGDFFGVSMTPTQADLEVTDGSELPFGNDSIYVVHTPGHTVGGVCYKIDDCLFTGDTLFNGTIGRADFPGGSFMTLIASLKKLAEIKGNYKVYPGHEDVTDLETEKAYNPYMKGM